MKLRRLDISGFKSFVDPVQVTFAGGITAIVGPNGCGKSNLSDAITWVLGEQSAKSLRGATMEDVIFNGSSSRKPIGMAEVALELETDASVEAAVEGRIRLGRRVFRDGQSQYRLNDKLVRLKTIRDLLMDTGLGIRAYSVIEQGKIGMILSGKPQERRKLLEEAAGITRYKARKQLAEVKLEEATANLLRLDDILAEVERALRSLKRQANAARRYQEREREYRELLRRVLLGRWSFLEERLAGLDRDLAARTAEDAAATADLTRDEAALARRREELDALAATVAEHHRRHAELAATIEGRQEYLKASRHTLHDLGDRLDQGRAQAAERRAGIDAERGGLENLDRRSAELLAERDAAAREVAEDAAGIAAVERRVTAAAAALEALRGELMASLARVNQTRAALQHEQVEIEKRTYRRRYLDEERQRLEAQRGESDAALTAVRQKIDALGERLTAAQARRTELAAALEALLRREAELSEERAELERRLAGHRQRRQILVELSEEHAERRRALAESLTRIGVATPRFLADLASPVEGWERSIDHFLGELSDAVVLEGGESALELGQALSGEDSSGVFLQPAAAGEASAEVDDPAILFSLAAALELPEEVARALPPAYLVDRAADAARLARAHPGVAFLSRERLWAVGGTVRVQGAAAAPGVLARESELEAIDREVPTLEERLAEVTASRQELVAERTRHAAEIHRLDDQVGELKRESAVAQARRQDAEGRLAKLTAELATVVDEAEEIDRELGTAARGKERLAGELEEAEEAHRVLAERLDHAQAEVEAGRAEREQLRTAGAGRRGRLELLEERLEAHDHEVARVRRQIEEAERQLAAWAEQEESLENRRRELEIGIERAEEELQIALERRAAAHDEVHGEQESLELGRDEIRRLGERVEARRQERDELRRRIEELRVDRAALRQDAEHMVTTFAEHFAKLLPGARGMGIRLPAPRPPASPPASGERQDELDASDDGEEPAASDAGDGEAAVAPAEESVGEALAEEAPEAEPNEQDGTPAADEAVEPLAEEPPLPHRLDRHQLAELEGRLAELKAVLERLGPVNVLAAQEYDEQQERHTFLTTQRQDVASSVDSLKATIREINQTSSVRFRDTFEVVNKSFGETFTRLFRGGEAEMRLLDEDDLLETGIEIVARPPGKRPQNIMLLSGGEKALTAIALLFALFRTKPSPFCILDEVDAPLDDANVLRFVELLRDLAADTQFLVITHNKLTMEIASTLYGVTMEEKGVSKLVSVELDQIQEQQDAATA